jgi:hypothetical protein
VNRGAVLGVLTALALAPPAAAHPVRDPPRIVPWHEIGDIGLGMSRRRVEAAYGTPLPGGASTFSVYAGRGTIDVDYDRSGRVSGLRTLSPEYATRSGTRVGMRILRGRCHRVHGACVFHWRGFTGHVLDTGVVPLPFEWRKVAKLAGPVRVTVQLEVNPAGFVTQIWLGRWVDCPSGEGSEESCWHPAVPSPGVARTLFGRWLEQRFGAVRVYETCPTAQRLGVGVYCLAELEAGGRWHRVSVQTRLLHGRPVVAKAWDSSWVRRWSPWSATVLRRGEKVVPGEASVNSLDFDWGWLVLQVQIQRRRHRSFTAFACDGECGGWERFFTFRCSAAGTRTDCVNAFGDAIRYDPTR